MQMAINKLKHEVKVLKQLGMARADDRIKSYERAISKLEASEYLSNEATEICALCESKFIKSTDDSLNTICKECSAKLTGY